MSKLTLNQVYDTIQRMKNKLNGNSGVTHVFKREDCEAVLIVLSDEKDLLNDKSIHLKVNVQHGVISITLKKGG